MGCVLSKALSRFKQKQTICLLPGKKIHALNLAAKMSPLCAEFCAAVLKPEASGACKTTTLFNLFKYGSREIKTFLHMYPKYFYAYSSTVSTIVNFVFHKLLLANRQKHTQRWKDRKQKQTFYITRNLLPKDLIRLQSIQATFILYIF